MTVAFRMGIMTYSQCEECEACFRGPIPAHTFNGHICPGAPVDESLDDGSSILAMAAYHLACPLDEDSDETTCEALRILRDARARVIAARS
jgi:hypothetical protein